LQFKAGYTCIITDYLFYFFWKRISSTGMIAGMSPKTTILSFIFLLISASITFPKFNECILKDAFYANYLMVATDFLYSASLEI
jgi:hypothetical protein